MGIFIDSCSTVYEVQVTAKANMINWSDIKVLQKYVETFSCDDHGYLDRANFTYTLLNMTCNSTNFVYTTTQYRLASHLCTDIFIHTLIEQILITFEFN